MNLVGDLGVLLFTFTLIRNQYFNDSILFHNSLISVVFFFFVRSAPLDYMWSSVKDPIDTPLTFDKDGLDLAFKYFTSSTLTMRLAGIAQINSHITSFNDICNSENMLEAEGVGQSLTTWLTDNNIISHIFGPNLHVEVFIILLTRFFKCSNFFTCLFFL